MDAGYRGVFYDNYVRLQTGKLHSHRKDEYERYSKFYAKKYARFLPNDRDARILDIGCGSGFFLYFLKKLDFKNALGIDISVEQAELAKSYGLNVQTGDMFDFLKKHLGEYEFIFSSHVIEHLKKNEIIDFLTCIYACLKPEGRVIICTPNALSLFGFAYHCYDITHETAFTPLSLRSSMEACGFRVVGIYPEWPVSVDLQSTIRTVLWNLIKPIIKVLFVIHSGIDLLRSGNLILENYIFAVGQKEI